MKLLKYSPLILGLLFNQVAKADDFPKANDLKHEIFLAYNHVNGGSGVLLEYRRKFDEFFDVGPEFRFLRVGPSVGYIPSYLRSHSNEKGLSEFIEEIYIGISAGSGYPIVINGGVGWRKLTKKINENKENFNNLRLSVGVEAKILDQLLDDFGMSIRFDLRYDTMNMPRRVFSDGETEVNNDQKGISVKGERMTWDVGLSARF